VVHARPAGLHGPGARRQRGDLRRLSRHGAGARFERLRHWLRSNSKWQAKKNIAYHYDLGNDFYRLWLDDSMTYSSALFRTGQEALERAQEQKYAAWSTDGRAARAIMCWRSAAAGAGSAEYAARERGLRVTGLTISKAQHAFAVARMKRPAFRPGRDQAAGLPRRARHLRRHRLASRCSRRWARNTGPPISTPCASG
jgi:hypothetical protein